MAKSINRYEADAEIQSEFERGNGITVIINTVTGQRSILPEVT